MKTIEEPAIVDDEVSSLGLSEIVLDARSLELTDDQFFRLCQDNRDLRFEMTAEGDIIIMNPTGAKTGKRNSELNFQLRLWAKQDGTGDCFDSSTAFTLPNGAKRSPDASWIRRERFEALTPDQQEVFAPICPDFVVELRSKTDRIKRLQQKMHEYIDNGAQLGWLIDPLTKKVYVYRPHQAEEVLEQPASISGDPVLMSFVLNLDEIW